jgi:hypothetical protein
MVGDLSPIAELYNGEETASQLCLPSKHRQI